MATKTDGTLWQWGSSTYGVLGQNNLVKYSSPVQIPGTTWDIAYANNEHTAMAIKTDNTLWAWGSNERGCLGQNSVGDDRSSPVQIPGTTWSKAAYGTARASSGAIKTDGTLWKWGRNYWGGLGINENEFTGRSSPAQIPGTTWSSISSTYLGSLGLKTNGTLWAWGNNDSGQLGQNLPSTAGRRSSPVQVGSDTDWTLINSHFHGALAIKEIG